MSPELFQSIGEIEKLRSELEQKTASLTTAIKIGEQAQNEIAALQRRLTEYAAEVERLLEALNRARFDFEILISRGDLADEPRAHQTLAMLRAAIVSVTTKPETSAKPDCYVDANSESTLNALETCREEREKLREGAKQIAEALQRCERSQFPMAEPPDQVTKALDKARKLGLLEKEE